MSADKTGDKTAAEEDTPLTTSQVARILECNDAWVRHLGRSGLLSSEVTPLGRLYSRADVEALKAERDKPGTRRSWHNTPAD